MSRNGTNFEQKAQWMRERQSASPASLSVTPSFAQRHYTVTEAAEFLNLSSDVARKIFQNEPGVFVLGQSARVQAPLHYSAHPSVRARAGISQND